MAKEKTRKMKKRFLKIIFLSLIISFIFWGLKNIGQTIAYLSDREVASGDSYQAGYLDLTLRSGQTNFVPAEQAENLKPGDSVARDIYLGKTADSLDLKHRVSYQFISGDQDFPFDLQISYLDLTV